MMNKGKKTTVNVFKHLVLVPLLTTFVFTACQDKKDDLVPTTKTKPVDEIRVEEEIPNTVVEEETVIPTVVEK
ncbi:hypothetical protein [Adhaeribacter arboris]|nr:hypothetical protein [Adhaeribacter arboris]